MRAAREPGRGMPTMGAGGGHVGAASTSSVRGAPQ